MLDISLGTVDVVFVVVSQVLDDEASLDPRGWIEQAIDREFLKESS